MMAYTETQLVQKNLFGVVDHVGQRMIMYVDVTDPTWTGEALSFSQKLADMKQKGQSLNGVRAYQICSAKEKSGATDVYYHVAEFEVAVSKKAKPALRRFVDANQSLHQKTRKKVVREINMPVIRMYLNGNPNQQVHCPFLKINLERFNVMGREPTWVGEGHHFKYEGRNSLLKEGADPGVIISSLDLNVKNRKTQLAIEDLSSVVFLSSTAHDTIHKVPNGDITDYSNDELPWALRNEENWEDWNRYLVAKGYDPLPRYEQWVKLQTL